LVLYEPEGATATEADTAEYALESSAFTDARPVTLTLHPTDPTLVGAPAGGTITADPCPHLEELKTGAVIGEIDQRPIIAFRTKAPLFRDLRGGETGADVDAVQSALRGLGYEASTSGQYDWLTKAAVNAFLKDRGVVTNSGDWGALSLTTVVWIGHSGTATVADCVAGVGDRVEEGDPLLSLITDPGSVTVSDVDSAVEGDRVLLVGDVRIPIAGSSIAEPDAVRQILATNDGSAAALRDEKTFGAVSELSAPINAYPVPPSALFKIDGTHACIAHSEEGFPVTIAASSLGLSYVVFEGLAPSAADVFPDRTLSCG